MSDAHLDHAKKAWPGVWANGHPAPGDAFPGAVSRTPRDEPGLTARADLPASRPVETGDTQVSPWYRPRVAEPAALGDDPRRRTLAADPPTAA